MQAPAEPGEGAGVGVDSRAAQILEEVIVQMNAVEAGLTRGNLVQIGQVVVDEVGKGLRWVHAGSWLALSCLARGARILVIVQ
jgi:hypothetical protein